MTPFHIELPSIMANTKILALATTTTEEAAKEVIASNYDLASQILLHLPATSVTKFKLASKLWCSISSDHYFITSHVLYNPPLLSGLFLHYFERPRATSHEYVALQPIKRNKNTPLEFVTFLNSFDLHVLQSCNGFLLCSSNTNGYYICNPTTLQRKRILTHKNLLGFTGPFAFNLAFDPEKSPHYTVVGIGRSPGREPKYQVIVYSSKTGQWRASGVPFIEARDLDFKHGVYCKGAIHWLKRNSSCLYYDIANDCFKSTPELPHTKQFDVSEREYFGQLNGQLYLVVRRHLPNFTLFEMEDDYSGWSMKCIVDLEVLASSFPSMARNFYNTPIFNRIYECNVLCLVNGSGSDESGHNVDLVVSTPGEIIYFNPYTKVSKNIANLMISPYDECVWFRDFFVHQFFETLCPVC